MNKHESPDASEFGKIRAYLAQNKVKQADITAVIGNGANGRTRAQIADTLREWLRTRPKAQ